MAMKMDLPAFAPTAIDSIPETCKTVRATFRSGKTKPLEWRKVQLRKLYWALNDFQAEIFEAFKRDLGKSVFETRLTDLDFTKNDVLFMLDNLDDFAREERMGAPEVRLALRPVGFRRRKEPLGAVLIIGTYNYPVNLLLTPLVGAIAAGCSAVIKPSEGAPNVAMVIRQLVEARLDRSAFAVVNGAVPEASALLDEKWAKIFYTGSTAVGTVVARRAAETLTPVALELGGRNPAFVTRNANLALAAKRLLWGKTLNAGQTCLSQNYVLVERPVVDEFVRQLNEAYRGFFPQGAKESDLARVVNEKHFLRMKKMLDQSKGKIVMGGAMDQSELYIEPTAVLVDSVKDSLMEEESFGPIFAIYPFTSLTEAIEIANVVDPTPLALFSLGSKEENGRVLNEVTSGGATLNDAFSHGSFSTIPFGGVGTSGTGAYRGKSSFDTFTHLRVVAETPAWMEPLLRVRYMPYDFAEMRRAAWLTGGGTPGFDRQGNVVRGVSYWTGLLLRLGGRGARGVLLRWLVVVAAARWVQVYGLTLPRWS